MWILTDCEEIGLFINAILTVRGHFNSDADVPVDETLDPKEMACLSSYLMGASSKLECFEADLAQLKDSGFAICPDLLLKHLTYKMATIAQQHGGILTDVYIHSNDGFIGLRVDHGSFEFYW